MATVLVIGGTGQVGSATVRALLKEHSSVKVRVGTRNASDGKKKLGKLADSVQVVQVSADDEKTWPAAFHGVSAVMIVRPGDGGGNSVVRLAGAAAATPSVQAVLLSTGFATADPSTPLMRSMLQLEQDAFRAVERHGKAFTLLRPHFFMENFLAPGFIGEKSFELPLQPDVNFSHIAVADIASVAAAVLAAPAVHNRRTYTLTGPDLKVKELGTVLSKVTGRKISVESLSDAEQRARWAKVGMPAPAIDAFASIYGQVASGALAYHTNAVRDVLGRDATSFQQWAQDHAHAFSVKK